jgi:hypothetical protein
MHILLSLQISIEVSIISMKKGESTSVPVAHRRPRQYLPKYRGLRGIQLVKNTSKTSTFRAKGLRRKVSGRRRAFVGKSVADEGPSLGSQWQTKGLLREVSGRRRAFFGKSVADEGPSSGSQWQTKGLL